jgi:hypothetical protein
MSSAVSITAGRVCASERACAPAWVIVLYWVRACECVSVFVRVRGLCVRWMGEQPDDASEAAAKGASDRGTDQKVRAACDFVNASPAAQTSETQLHRFDRE